MRIAVCDDEKTCLEKMKKLLQKYPGVSRTEYYQDLDKLTEVAQNGTVYDLILMDIEWNGRAETGIRYAAEFCKKYPHTQFVFVTAYNDKFAQKIFWEDVNLGGYLVKPVQEENLTILLNKAKERIYGNEELILQRGRATERIRSEQILYIESSAHQILIHTLDGEITTYEKLDVIEKKMQKNFLRIHKSFLVNMQYIRRIEMKEVTMQDGTVLPVSKTRYSASRDKYFRFMRAML